LATLARRLGSVDLLLIVVGSIIGSGIFRAPSVVAQRVHTPGLILIAWIGGGVIALFGSFVLAELAARRPDGFGVYTYLRDAFHPLVGFAYGWTALLVAFTGGIAAAAILFAGYFEPLTGLHVPIVALAVGVILVLTLVTCAGVRGSSNVQNALAVLKIACVGGLIVAGFVAHPAAAARPPLFASLGSGNLLSDLGIALIPVLFAYNGAIVASFMGGETKAPARSLPFGLWSGMLVVVVLFVAANAGFVRALGTDGLAATATPVSDVLRLATGPFGERLAALAVVLVTLGFISNRMLTAPRLYYAMAKDGLFFPQAAWVEPRTRVPVIAIGVQGLVAIAIALSGSYERVLNYVVSTAYVFAGLFALAIFVLRARDRRAGAATPVFRVPGHPVSTVVVIAVSWAVALDTYVRYPADGLFGLAILASAVPVYLIWIRSATRRSERPR
jgi:APA family basic amino acid/polyamine antiporter